MGYAVIMFVILLLMAVTISLTTNYGVSKDSQEAPLLAENAYAEREAGKAQTGLTIVNTCLSGSYRYVDPTGPANQFGPYTLNLTVRNNGSIVLNPKNSTIFYNISYVPFNVATGEVWTPLTNSTMLAPNIYIYSSDANYPLRLMMAASNGITTIAPTTPTNFSGVSIKANTTYSFTWNASTDDIGIAYYILYGIKNNPSATCPPTIDYISVIPGNYTTTSLNYQVLCDPNCNTDYFFMVAVDTEGNMGIPTVTLVCNPGQGQPQCDRRV